LSTTDVCHIQRKSTSQPDLPARSEEADVRGSPRCCPFLKTKDILLDVSFTLVCKAGFDYMFTFGKKHSVAAIEVLLCDCHR